MANLNMPEGKIEFPMYSLKRPSGGFADMFAATAPESVWEHFTALLDQSQEALESLGFRLVECEFESVPTGLEILGHKISVARLKEKVHGNPSMFIKINYHTNDLD